MEVCVRGETFELPDDLVKEFAGFTEMQQSIVLLKLMGGMTHVEIYKTIGKKITTESSAAATVSEILNRPNISLFLERVQGLRFSRHIMSRDEMACMLSELARTNVDDIIEFINDEDPKAQQRWRLRPLEEMRNAGIKAINEVTAGKDGLKVKTVGKLEAAKQLSQLLGYDKAQKIDVKISKGLNDLYDEFEEQDGNG